MGLCASQTVPAREEPPIQEDIPDRDDDREPAQEEPQTAEFEIVTYDGELVECSGAQGFAAAYLAGIGKAKREGGTEAVEGFFESNEQGLLHLETIDEKLAKGLRDEYASIVEIEEVEAEDDLSDVTVEIAKDGRGKIKYADFLTRFKVVLSFQRDRRTINRAVAANEPTYNQFPGGSKVACIKAVAARKRELDIPLEEADAE